MISFFDFIHKKKEEHLEFVHKKETPKTPQLLNCRLCGGMTLERFRFHPMCFLCQKARDIEGRREELEEQRAWVKNRDRLLRVKR